MNIFKDKYEEIERKIMELKKALVIIAFFFLSSL